MTKKTYYDVLQVSKIAAPGVVEAAYRSLVQYYHQATAPGNLDAERQLRTINRAYEVLSDPEKRRRYDSAPWDADVIPTIHANSSTFTKNNVASPEVSPAKNNSPVPDWYDLNHPAAKPKPKPKPPKETIRTDASAQNVGGHRMRYVYAVVACIGLFTVYVVIGGILGWKHGGGAIPTILFFVAVGWTWNAITGTKGLSDPTKRVGYDAAFNDADESQDIQPGAATSTKKVGLYKAIIGEKNTNYYLTKFEQFDQQGTGFKASWNWPAFIFVGAWPLYRKMYGWFFALCGVALLSDSLEKTGSPGLGAIIALGPWAAFAIYANSLYHNGVKKKIAVAQLSIHDESLLVQHLNHKGGVNTWVIWVSVLIPVIGILAAITIPAFDDFQQRAAGQRRQQPATVSEKDPLGLYRGASPQNQQPATGGHGPNDTPVKFGGYGPNDTPVDGASPQSQQSTTQHDLKPYEKRTWSGNVYGQFDSVDDIERKARGHDPRLNDPRAWEAVRAWQTVNMDAWEKPANVALYVAVDTVLEGFKRNKGVCRPGKTITVDAAGANKDLPIGTQLVMEDCDY